MHIKLLFVLILFIYHGYCHYIYLQLQQNTTKWSSTFFRIWNEVATIILIAIVFLVVLKNSFDWIYGVIGIIGVSLLLMIGIKLYKRIREKNQS
jgi:putative membrane protein